MTESCEVTEDAFLGGRLRLRQPRRGHRAGHDAMLLAAATAIAPDQTLLDFGAGIGAAGLAVARRVPGIRLTLVEIDPALLELARQNILLNDLAADATALDLAAPARDFAEAGLMPDSADCVMMNPPFNSAALHQASPDRARRLAHQAQALTLEAWIHAARRLLRPGGAVTLIWRAQAIDAVLAALGRGFGGIVIRPVHAAPGKAAIRILVRAIKGGRSPLTLLPGLVLNDAAGVPSAEADAILRDAQALSMADR
jgi:tRNA1(Val) A37 N6-methylase TrmN6